MLLFSSENNLVSVESYAMPFSIEKYNDNMDFIPH